MEEKQTCCGSVYDQIPPLSPKHVWLVAQNLDAEEDDDEVQIFYDVQNPLCHYRCRIPELLGKQIRGCFYGWVILSNYSDDVMWSLWNPITSKFIYLPPLVHKQQSDSDNDNDDDIGYCCLSSPPDDPNSILLLTRSEKPNFVFCRLYPKKKKLRRWTEMSYAKQVKRVTDGLVHCLTCCNGKVYAYVENKIVEVSIVVKDTEVTINLLPLLKLPSPDQNVSQRHLYLVGSCTELFSIFIDSDEVTETISFVYLFKLNTKSNTWEELEDLEDATLSLEYGSYFCPKLHSPSVTSELGGYIHMLGENGKIIYSYHVKDKTMSISSMPCLAGTSHVSAWTMLECKRLSESDDKQEEDKKDEIVVSKVKSDEVEFIGTTDESHLLNLPFDVLKMIMEFSVGIEYMNFRASCKLCHLAAPIILWSNQKTSKRLQLQAYSLASPWLMVIGKHTITYIDPVVGNKYFMKTPRELGLIGQLKIHCSRYGWLLMRKCDEGPLILFNPFTRDTRELPQDHYLDSFGFSAPPTSPNCMVVGFTSMFERHIHIHFVGQESSWRELTLDFGDNDPFFYRFPVFYGQDVYALSNKKGLDVFKELGEGGLAQECVIKDAPISCCTSYAQRYLMKCDHEYECDQHLLLVIVGVFGESVEVFMPNKDAGKWEKIDDIGRHMIYIGDKTSLCMEAKTPEMENKIYFPRSRCGKMVVYSLKTYKFHTFNGKNIHESFGDFFGTGNHLSHNVWIEPSWS